MKRFIRLSLPATLAVLATACSSSSTPSGGGTTADSGVQTYPSTDAGNQGTADSGGVTPTPDAGGEDAGSCAPASLGGDGGAQTYTATVGQKVCSAAEISAFVAACGSAATNTSCGDWANGDAGACAPCLLSTGSGVAPFEVLSVNGQEGLAPSAGACVLASEGAPAASCAAALDAYDNCLIVACYSCESSQAQEESCGSSANAGECAGVSAAYASACGSYQTIAKTCIDQQQTPDSTLANEANVICGTGVVADAGATGDAGDAGQ